MKTWALIFFSRGKYKAYNRQISLYLKGEMIYDR